MTLYSFPYAHSSQEIELDLPRIDRYVPSQSISPVPNPDQEIIRCLCEPVDGITLRQFIGAKSAAIAINDKTRPTPLRYLIPNIVRQLNEIGIPNSAIWILISVGTHTPATADEIQALKATFGTDLNIFSHDCDDADQLVFLGETTRGTPVSINRRFMQADLRIVTGNIEPHHFMGFSGGVKTASIGLAGRATIRKNHAMLGFPGTEIGSLEHNPMRQDIEEIGKLAQIHLAVNTILTDDFHIVRAFSGRPENVIQAGVALSRELCQITIPHRYDLVIASAGGHPKDINLYQAQKAISHAALFAKPGGIIVLAAACSEGPGSQKFEHFMQDVHSVAQVYEKFQQTGFEIGYHKAFQIAKQVEENRVLLVSMMPPELTRHLLLEPAESLQAAFECVQADLPDGATVALLPFATHLIARLA